MNITFTLSKENFPEIANFDINELNTISKQLFIEWYNKTYTINHQQVDIDNKLELINSRLSNQITSSLSNFIGKEIHYF
jgi:hypothetical protein